MSAEGQYIEKGRVIRVWIASIPVKDLQTAIDFYAGVLGLDLQIEARDKNWVEVGPDEPGSKIGLYVPDKDEPRQPGGPTGIVLETDSIYELHRKLVDEEVLFLMKPEKQAWGGLMATFMDPYGNELQVVEDPEYYQRSPKPAPVARVSKCDERDRSCKLS